MGKSKGLMLLVVLMLTIALVAGCGGSEPAGEPPAGENPPADTNTGGAESSLAELFSLGKSKTVESMSFDMTATDPTTGTTIESKAWMKGEKVKVESSTPEGRVITLITPEAMYSIMPDQNMAIKMTNDQTGQTESSDPLEYTESEDWNPDLYKEVGKETVDGKSCRVVESVEDGSKAKLYIWEEWGFPIKVENYEGGKLVNVMEYKNLSVNSVSDSEFELPAGIEVQDMGSFNMNIPGMPGVPQN